MLHDAHKAFYEYVAPHKRDLIRYQFILLNHKGNNWPLLIRKDDTMRLVIISDTHSNRVADLIPKGDVLIHCGDLTISGSVPEINAVALDLGKCEHPLKLIIPGNHDFLFEHSPRLARDILGPDFEVLIDQEYVVNGIKFYGSPHQPVFFDWAFNQEPEDLERYWSLIPDDTDILITHGPAKHRLDWVPRGQFVGCEHLEARIEQLHNLKLHCFGHIHYGYGWEFHKNRLYVNAALCDHKNWIANDPIVIDIDDVTKEVTVIPKGVYDQNFEEDSLPSDY